MIDQAKKQKLDSLLKEGVITQREYNHLLNDTENDSAIVTIFKALLTIILTFLAIVAIIFGVCFVLIMG